MTCRRAFAGAPGSEREFRRRRHSRTRSRPCCPCRTTFRRAPALMGQHQHRCEGRIAFSLPIRSRCQIEQPRVVAMDQTDLFPAAGSKCCKFHDRLLLLIDKIYDIRQNIDKQEKKIWTLRVREKYANGRRSMTRFLATAAVAAILAVGSAYAQTKIQIGCTATSDCASAMVA